jgi:hypothetical protein
MLVQQGETYVYRYSGPSKRRPLGSVGRSGKSSLLDEDMEGTPEKG